MFSFFPVLFSGPSLLALNFLQINEDLIVMHSFGTRIVRMRVYFSALSILNYDSLGFSSIGVLHLFVVFILELLPYHMCRTPF